MDESGRTPIVIVIAGGSASGKSLLAQRLAQACSAAVLGQDAFYRVGLPASTNFDHPASIDWQLFEMQLESLVGGSAATIPSYDFATHARIDDSSIVVPPADVLVVEGLHVLTDPAVRRHVDVGVFVHTPADLRLLRRVRRDVTERGRTVASVLAQYEEHVRPMHLLHVQPSEDLADLVVDGTRPPSDNVAIVRAFCGTRGHPV